MKSTFIISVIFGILLIVCGILVVKYPSSLNGFKSLNKDRFKSHEVQNAIKFISISLIIGGFVAISGSTVLSITNSMRYIFWILLSAILIPLLCYLYQYEKVLTEKEKVKFYFMVILTCFIIVGIVFYKASRSPALSVQEGFIDISCYRFYDHIPTENVSEVNLVQKLPSIKRRSNGLAVNETRLGYFETNKNEKIKLYSKSYRGPYIYISTKDNKYIYINYVDSTKTKQVFDNIKKQIKIFSVLKKYGAYHSAYPNYL
ncbi:MAG: hypothetical protein ACTTKN_03560 [Phocaeicola sp.]|uniref:hypothetical protein n=1 Tax=Phocaeicola TaxID=909656 RepID=UPI00234E9D58|nr:hypothetical protein [Phocaeicola oris]MCE2615766.1 hypothetical protein [Phocaeicola oris]